MNNQHIAPTTCPVCSEPMAMRVLACPACSSELHGDFPLPRLARLPKELQDVVEVFLKCRGNIKEVERELGISYPTVSKKLDAINALLDVMGQGDERKTRILRQLEAGEISASDAVRLLRQADEKKQKG